MTVISVAMLVPALLGAVLGQCSGGGGAPETGSCARAAEVDDFGMLQLAMGPSEEEVSSGCPAACRRELPESPALAPYELTSLLGDSTVDILGGSKVTLWGKMPNSGCSPQGPEQILRCDHKPGDDLTPEQTLTWIDAGSHGGVHYFALKASSGLYCGVSAVDGLVRCDQDVVGRCEKFEMNMDRYPIMEHGLKSPCKKETCKLALDRLVRCERSKGDTGGFYLSCENCRATCADHDFSTSPLASAHGKHGAWMKILAHRCPKVGGWTCDTYAEQGWCYGGAVAPCGRVLAGVDHGSPEDHCCACGGGRQNATGVRPFRPSGYTPWPMERLPWEGSKTCPPKVGASGALRGPEGMSWKGELSFMAGSKVALWGPRSLPKPGCAYATENQGEVRCDRGTTLQLETHRQLFTFVEAGSQNFTDTGEQRFFALQASDGHYCGVEPDPDAALEGGVLRCNKKTVGPCEKFRMESHETNFYLSTVMSMCDSPDFRTDHCQILHSRQVVCGSSAGSMGSRLFITCEKQCQTKCADTAVEGEEEWASGDDCRSQGFTAEEGCSERGWTCEAYRQKGWCYGGSVAPCFREMAGHEHNRPEQHCCLCGGGGEKAGKPNENPFRPPGVWQLPPIMPEKCGVDGKTCPDEADPSPPMTPHNFSLIEGELKMIGGSLMAIWVTKHTATYDKTYVCELSGLEDGMVMCRNQTYGADLEKQRFTLVDAGVYNGRRWFGLQGMNGMYCGVGDAADSQLPGVMRCNKKILGNCDIFDLKMNYPQATLESFCNSPDFNPSQCGLGFGGYLSCSGGTKNILVSCEGNCGTECTDAPVDWANGEDCMKDGFGEEDGCSEGGWTCEGYQKNGWCLGGSVSPCFKDKAGRLHENPEEHCCICGGGEKGGIKVPPFHKSR